MKKTFIMLAAVCLLASCNGQKQQKNAAVAESTKSFEQEQIEANIKLQIDSLAAAFARMGNIPFMASLMQGELVLSEQEKQVKPEYLLDLTAVNDLITLSQKYRAVALVEADKVIAKAYDMPLDEYDAAMQKLVIDIDDAAFKVFIEEADTMAHADLVEKFYNAENENGRINFFWDTTTSYMVEQLYIISQDANSKFIDSFTDEAASDITYRIILFQDALECLKDYVPELTELCEAIRPLNKLNAISVDQLKSQLAEMNEEIKDIRNGLLK